MTYKMHILTVLHNQSIILDFISCDDGEMKICYGLETSFRAAEVRLCC